MILDLSNPLEVVVLVFGIVVTLQKVVEMERYHDLRVTVLTILLSFAMFYLFLIGAPLPADPIWSDCPEDNACFSHTKM
jgi:hypothetical protein